MDTICLLPQSINAPVNVSGAGGGVSPAGGDETAWHASSVTHVTVLVFSSKHQSQSEMC